MSDEDMSLRPRNGETAEETVDRVVAAARKPNRGRRSRRKGANGERGWRDLLRKHGFEAERTGRTARHTKDDVSHNVEGVHFEVKRQERLNIPAWVRQAKRDAGDRVACVAYKRSREEWRCDVPAEWLLQLLEDRATVQVVTTNEEGS